MRLISSSFILSKPTIYINMFSKGTYCENVAQFSYSVAKEIYVLSMACEFVLHS